MSNVQVPEHARVVIIGGGIIGCSIAYHLGHLGWSDVVLLERDALTSGTTWHAAGLMTTFGSTSETAVEIRKYTRELYDRLEEETGLSTGFERIGFIEMAADADRLEEYRRVAAFNRLMGNPVEEIGPDDIKRMFPLARTDDILAGFYLPQDGRVNPVDATMALAKGGPEQGREADAARLGDGREHQERARDGGDDEPREHPGRVRHQLRRDVGAAARRAERGHDPEPGGRASPRSGPSGVSGWRGDQGLAAFPAVVGLESAT